MGQCHGVVSSIQCGHRERVVVVTTVSRRKRVVLVKVTWIVLPVLSVTNNVVPLTCLRVPVVPLNDWARGRAQAVAVAVALVAEVEVKFGTQPAIKTASKRGRAMLPRIRPGYTCIDFNTPCA